MADEVYDLKRAYFYHRDRPGRYIYPARKALELARKDRDNNKPRYYSRFPNRLGEPFRVGGSQMRWCEDPAAAGLRLIDYADKVVDLRHQGWYTDDEGISGELARGMVFRLPHGKLVAGIADPCNDGPAMVDLENLYTNDDERRAAYAADRLAEAYAESERDYRRAANARMQYDDLAGEIREDRREALKLFAEIRKIRSVLCDNPTIIATLRAHIAELRRSIAKARKKRADLAADYRRHEGWAT